MSLTKMFFQQQQALVKLNQQEEAACNAINSSCDCGDINHSERIQKLSEVREKFFQEKEAATLFMRNVHSV
jgi:positive regulator of sigma E activity